MPSRTPLVRAAALAATLSAALLVGLASPAVAAIPGDKNCADFEYREDAQEFFEQAGPGDPHELDRDGDGRVCEGRPSRGTATPPTTTTPPPTTEPTEEPSEDPAPPVEHHDEESDDSQDAPSTTPTHESAPIHPASTGGGDSGGAELAAVDRDRDCADFPTQAEAQAALMNDLSDPERLDADDDGIACEDSFGTEGRQVAVFPLGGVATGGSGLR